MIKEIVENLNEASTKEAEAFVQRTEDNFLKNFKNGFIKSRMYKGIGGTNLITFDFGLIANLNDVSHRIRENDPMYHSVMIHCGDLYEKNEMEALQSGISTNPPEGSYYAMTSVKTKLRKTKGDLKKLEKTLNTFFGRLKILMKDNQGNLYADVEDKYFV